jgi:hypothetical protein
MVQFSLDMPMQNSSFKEVRGFLDITKDLLGEKQDKKISKVESFDCYAMTLRFCN